MTRENLKNQVNSKIVNDELSEEEMIHDIMQMVDAHVTQQLILSGVSQQRELLLAYEQSKCPETWWMSKNQAENEVNDFIANNCG